jgi:hypothetical protein
MTVNQKNNIFCADDARIFPDLPISDDVFLVTSYWNIDAREND